MRARDLMTFQPLTVRPGTSMKDVARRMLAQEAHAMPVVDLEDRIIGIVTDRELLEAMRTPSESAPRGGKPVGESPAIRHAVDIMSRAVVCASADTDAVQLAGLMLDNHVRHVVVLDHGRLVGIVSSFDVIKAVARPDEDIARDLLELLEALVDQVATAPNVRDGVVVIDPWCDESTREAIHAAARSVPGVIGVADPARGTSLVIQAT